MTNKRWRRLAIMTFKYCPIITAFIMLIHVCLLLCGITLGWAESFCGLSLLPLIVTYCLSKGLGFCSMHRMFIDYTFKIYLCIQWLQWIGFGDFLTIYRWLMLILGVAIFLYFLIHIKEFVKCKPINM